MKKTPITSLESFLQKKKKDGHKDSEGQISLDVESALEKFAQYRLPREACWILKLIQTAIASDTAGPIHIQQSRKIMKVSFPTAEEWPIEVIQERFFDPVVREEDRALNHLLVALWGVGIQEKRPFQITLPSWEQSLTWDGESLVRTEKEDEQLFWLTVSHFPIEQELGFWGRYKQAKAANSSVIKELNARAFTCPVPLHLDKRRIDLLHSNPSHGFAAFAHPIALGLGEAELPPLRLPPGTFENIKQSKWMRHKHLQKASDLAVEALPEKYEASFVYMVSFHIGLQASGKTQYWKTRPQRSQLYWVTDGVVGHKEYLSHDPLCASAACFINGDNLETDLTTLNLRQSEERLRRYRVAVEAMVIELKKSRDVCLQKLVDSKSMENKLTGAGLIFLGLLTIVAVPVSALFFWAGHGLFKDGGKEVQEVLDPAFADLAKLSEAWDEGLDCFR